MLLIAGTIIFREQQQETQAIQENIEEMVLMQENTLMASAIPMFPYKSYSYGALMSFEVYDLISQYNGWNADLMYEIAFCESSFNPRAIGDRNTAYQSYGILQIRNLPSRNYSIETLFDPAENIKIGYDIFLKE